MWSMLSLIESPGRAAWRDRPREEEEEAEEEVGGRERTDRLAGRRGADQFSPSSLSVMSSQSVRFC